MRRVIAYSFSNLHSALGLSSTILVLRQPTSTHFEDVRKQAIPRPLGAFFSTSKDFRSHSSIDSSPDATIYALSTAPGRAAIAIIRCSGALCMKIYEGLCPGVPLLRPRHASLRTLYNPDHRLVTREVLDSAALILYFPGPKTVTGEDVLEFHVHGGPAIVKAVLDAVPKSIRQATGTVNNIRYAEPGEFTRRAFYNNRLDLTQVEALGDTLSAETEQQRRLAVRGLSNTLNERYKEWIKQLLYARGEFEALIDFSEDQHFDESAEEFVQSVSEQIRKLLSQIHKTTRNAVKGELLRHGIKIAFLGAPNAGKSSLLNQIVGREAAIVSPEAGTTRDVIEVNVDIRGYFCKFNDLAGVRSQTEGDPMINDIETEGITRAKACARQADVVVVVIPVDTNPDNPHGHSIIYSREIIDFIKEEVQEHQKIMFVLNKSDLAGSDIKTLIEEANIALKRCLNRTVSVIPISCISAAEKTTNMVVDEGGLQAFLNSLSEVLSTLTTAEPIDFGNPATVGFDESLGTTQRQQALLQQCAHELTGFLDGLKSDYNSGAQSKNVLEVDVVLLAERLRCAANCLAKITGRGECGDVEEVLGVVFEKFCVGK